MITFDNACRRRAAGAALGLLLVLAPAASAGEPAPLTKVTSIEGVTEYRLDNGLRILLYPDPSTPKLTVMCTVFVGSRHEGHGETGMAHLLEHMNLKCTAAHPDLKKAVSDRGGAWQGTTTKDRTNFYEILPAGDDNLEFAISLEADRLVNCLIRREDLISEMTVVRNEFERAENDPSQMLQQRVESAAYEWHNYGKAIIGNRSDIERIPVDSLRAFYRKHYRPDNALLIVAGKFDESRALAHVARYFGPVKNPAARLESSRTNEPAQDGERRVTLRRVGTSAEVAAVYHIPAAAHPDFAALTVLGRILQASPTGRLYKALVTAKKSSDIGATPLARHDPGLFCVGAQVDRGQSTDDVLRVTLDTVEQLASNPVTAAEVEQARTELTSGWQTISTFGMVERLCEWAACGDWRLLFLHRDRLARVTAADVNRVAARYLVHSNRTVGVYVPTEKPERAAVPETTDIAAMFKDYSGNKAVTVAEEFEPTAENLEKRLRRLELACGVKAALLPRKSRGDLVMLQLTLRYGNEQSLAGQREACDYLPVLMRRGSRKHDFKALEAELPRLGNAVIAAGGGVGEANFTVQCQREHLPKVLALLGEVLREPALPAEEFETIKRATIESLRGSLKEPGSLSMQALRRTLRPWDKDNIRHIDTLDEAIAHYESVTLEQVRRLYAEQLGAAHGQLVIVGDFEPDATVRQMQEMLAGWKSATPYQRIADLAKTSDHGSIEMIQTPDKANAFYRAGFVLHQLYTDPDYAALTVGNYILGQPCTASRLWTRLREKDGLSYHVQSVYVAGNLDPSGGFEFVAICNPANMPRVERAIIEEIERLLKDGVTQAELDAAKKAILAERRLFSAVDIAASLALQLTDGDSFAGYARRSQAIGALTVEQVNAALRKHLQPKKLHIVEAGDFHKAADTH